MDPTAVLLVLTLAVPLDSPDYRVRERARMRLEASEPVMVWPAVVTLLHSGKPAVSEAAERCLVTWRTTRVRQELERLIGKAIREPMAAKPWREAVEFERGLPPAVWRREILPLWNCVIRPMVRAKYPNATAVTLFDYDSPWQEQAGTLAETVWHIRVIEELNGGNYRTPEPHEW